MLEFVRQRAVIAGTAGCLTIETDIEHLAFVAIRIDAGWILVLSREIPAHVASQTYRVQYGQMHIIVDAWRPLAAKSGAIGRVNRALKKVGRGLQSSHIHRLS